jgi:hypothetical protein
MSFNDPTRVLPCPEQLEQNHPLSAYETNFRAGGLFQLFLLAAGIAEPKLHYQKRREILS